MSEMLPKTAIGSVHLEFKKCGRPVCRCSKGELHGPYFYRHWREEIRQRKEYIRRKDVISTLAAIALQQQMFPSSAEMIRLCRVKSKEGAS